MDGADDDRRRGAAPATLPGFCTLCRSRCGTRNTVEAGRLVRVEPDPDHPTGRALCAKGRAAPEIAHGSRRLATPLRRTRPKGAADPGWEPIGWDAAMAEIAARLGAIRAESGAEAVGFAVTSPSATPISDSIEWIERLIRVFGSPNTAYATEICNWHKDFAHAFTFGAGIGTPDYANAELILLWGHNPANAWLAAAGAIAEGRAKGARLLVVDPRRTAHAAQADHWLQPLPGTDAALALGLAGLLIDEGRIDAAFLREWTNAPCLVREDDGLLLRAGTLGLSGPPDRPVVLDAATGTPHALNPCHPEAAPQAGRLALRGRHRLHGADGADIACRPAFDLLAEACAAWTPGRVADATGVPETALRAAAAAIGAARRISYYGWTGIGQSANATQTDRAIAVLYALTGSLDRTGGNRQFPRLPANPANPPGLLAPAQAAKALGLAARPLGPPARGWVTAADLCAAILERRPYAVRALLSFGANLLVSQPDPARTEAALAALEFHVHCDLYETPAARFADILLPVNSPWEREGLRLGFELDAASEELVQLRPRMVPPLGESRSDLEIVFDLAVRLGHGDAFFGGDVEAGWNHQLAPLGLDVATLRRHPAGRRVALPREERRFAARRARGEPAFATPSGLVEIYSETLLRHGQPPLPRHVPPPDAPGPGLPLLLTTAKDGYFCHSQHRGIASLRRRVPEPWAALHPAAAAARDVAEGDWLAIRTRAGAARFRARLDATLHPGVVVAEYGWWEGCPDLGLPGYVQAGAAGSSYNALVADDHADPVSGSVPMRGIACEATRAGPGLGWPDFREFRVAAVEPEAEGVVSLRLAAADGGALPDYRPGQHLTIRLPGPDGVPVTRAYSLSGPAGRRDYRITVRRVVGRDADGAAVSGLASTRITQGLAPGDRVEARQPDGRFTIPLDAPFPVVLLAAGIGITPFLGYLESLVGRPDPPRVVLHYGNRDGAGHAFRERLRALTALLPTLRIVDHYSRPRGGERAGRDFDRHGRITAADVAPALIAARARFYLCGPETMLRDLAAGLAARGVPRFEIFQETFHAAGGDVAAGPAGPFSVTFRRSGRTLRWQAADGPLLGFAEAAGLRLPGGCRVGQCESCAVARLAGEIRYLAAIEAEDPGLCLTCRAVPASDLVLDA
ncbi:molybdopterin-dependent oxidoreductase [Roseomonas sp. NAR14]|uniref:Molybdopterin-dependent oxidoreductase n=1 Tax=Roseomonas acroporae TaxID=2937791 RepID=A0A9X1YAV5_9PROT|nr:molybdopterin-dependent oxidoreductase [Roseomonas acroporae]MCK8787059.1 molybdopterin-dependent oxidoreductase [Roseomonas acroporae]